MPAPIKQLTSDNTLGGIPPEIAAQFSEIILPTEVGIWPFSWQLWLLIGILTMLAISAIFFALRYFKKQRAAGPYKVRPSTRFMLLFAT